MLNRGDINRAILSVFDSLEEDVDYKMTNDTFTELNKFRKEHGYSVMTPFTFRKEKNNLVFNWKNNNWSNSTIKIDRTDSSLALALTLAFPFAIARVTFAFALAFAENRIQKVKKTCEGQTVTIEGIEYKLVRA